MRPFERLVWKQQNQACKNNHFRGAGLPTSCHVGALTVRHSENQVLGVRPLGMGSGNQHCPIQRVIGA